MNDRTSSVGDSLRQWRKSRKMSQLALALKAGVSSRHISFVETGKSQPTQEMLVKLADALELSATQQNALLLAAGFSTRNHDSDWHSTKMRSIRSLVEQIVENLNPFPSFVVDGNFDTLFLNQSTRALLNALDVPRLAEGSNNMYRTVFASGGMFEKIANWDEVKAFMLARLRESAFGTGNDALQQLVTQLAPVEGKVRHSAETVSTATMHFVLRHDDLELRFNAVLLRLGDPFDNALNDWRIIVFVPANKRTRDYITNMKTVQKTLLQKDRSRISYLHRNNTGIKRSSILSVFRPALGAKNVSKGSAERPYRTLRYKFFYGFEGRYEKFTQDATSV